MQAEVDRLSTNWRTLLDAMPEMVFLVREDGGVEYLNRSAAPASATPARNMSPTASRPSAATAATASRRPPPRRGARDVLGSIPVEFSACAHFIGYTADG